MYQKIVFFFILTLLLSGCIQNINQKGLTISIPASHITESLEQQFPISKAFNYGKLTLKNPKALLQTGSDRVQAGTEINFSNTFIPTQTGKLYLSGKPLFDAQSGSIYLREPAIESLEFNGYKLNAIIQNALNDALLPIISDIFHNRPIYKLNQNSLHSSFVNNIYVQDGQLLVTFGL
ncbi:MAG: DUF1439 domain-containing protein [Epsilonproteobacteria bacterium]|nr:DUF1439 domain-containing protein [Campylobacterota bacterium]